MASSVPSRPSYFLRTASRSMERPSASSPMATETPPAPKSLQRLIMPGHVAVAEQPLDLALFGGVALLHLGGHGGQGRQVVALGGAGGAADAVTAGAAAQQDDHVAGRGLFPAPQWRQGAAPTTAPSSMCLAT